MASGAAGDPAGRAVGGGRYSSGGLAVIAGAMVAGERRSTSFSGALCPPDSQYSARTHGDGLHRSRGWHSWALSRGGARLRRGAYPAWCLGCSICDSREEINWRVGLRVRAPRRRALRACSSKSNCSNKATREIRTFRLRKRETHARSSARAIEQRSLKHLQASCRQQREWRHA